MNTPVDIIQGGKVTLTIRLVDSLTGDPFDLTGVTAIETCFLNADATELMLALGTGIIILGNPILGKIAISLTAAQTALLDLVSLATLELAVTTSGDPIKIQIPQVYSVLQSEC